MKYELALNKEQAEMIIKAIDGYLYIVSDVLSYEETQHYFKIKQAILDQLPKDLF